MDVTTLPEYQMLTPSQKSLVQAYIAYPDVTIRDLGRYAKGDNFAAHYFLRSDRFKFIQEKLKEVGELRFDDVNYVPDTGQKEIHDDEHRFRVLAAGRRRGKTFLGINETIRQAALHPQTKDGPIERSWFVCNTYKQAEMVGWRLLLKFLPEKWIKRIRHAPHLEVELVNGHIIELKGAENSDSLRGVALRFVVIDEYGLMREDVWTEVIRPMLVDTKGRALFIGTPGPDGSPHFHEIYNLGLGSDPAYKSWLHLSVDNPRLPKEEIEEARRTLPADIYKREFEADFDVTAGLIYDNFRHAVHVIPNYQPSGSDFIVGSIDPGLNNPTASLLCAWDQTGVGRIFWEYYEEDRIADENAQKIRYQTRMHKVGYWVIDSASKDRSQTGGQSVYQKYQKWLMPLLPAVNNPGTVWSGIDEVKKLLHADPKTGRPRLYVSATCNKFLWEISRYIRYKRRWHSDQNEAEKPRKLNDHLMDCIRNQVNSKPWMRPSIRVFTPSRSGYPI